MTAEPAPAAPATDDTPPSGLPTTDPPARIAAVLGSVAALFSRVSAATVYLVIAVVWGLTLCFLVPPLQQFDEVAHFQRAWAVSTGQITTDRSSEVRLPQAVVDLPAALGYIEVGEGRIPYSPRRTLELLGETSAGSDVDTLCFAVNPLPFGHLPEAVGVVGARVLHLSPLAALYAARLVNLLVSVLVVYMAIRTLPFGRPLYVLVGLLPMAVNQFASVNPDGLSIAGAMLFFACVLRLRVSPREATNLEAVLLVAAGAVLLNVKPGYQLFALLALLVPAAVWGGRRRLALWVALVVAGTFAVAMVNQALIPRSSPEMRVAHYGPRGADIDGTAQLDLVLSDPTVFFSAIRKTAGVSGVPLGMESIGILGRGMVPLSQTVVYLVLAAFAGTLVATRDGPSLGWWGRGLVALVGGSTLVLLALAMYMAATTIGAGEVAGLQGRYFIPVIAIGVFVFIGLPRPPRWTLPLIVAGLAAVLALFSISALIRYYY